MCSCDIELPVVYEQIVRVARKPHVCSECRETIWVREGYTYISGCWDGRWEHYKICSSCVLAQTIVSGLVDCFCSALGQLWHDIEQYDLLEEVAFKMESLQ